MRRAVVLMFALLVSSLSWSAVEIVEFDDPEYERRYKVLIEELRCLVCQNQNIASSNADLAKDLRQQVYQRIHNGESDEQIIAFMVARYGDFVLYKPPLNAKTGVLWIGPFVLLIAGVAIMLVIVRRGSGRKTPDVDAEGIGRARRILENKEK